MAVVNAASSLTGTVCSRLRILQRTATSCSSHDHAPQAKPGVDLNIHPKPRKSFGCLCHAAQAHQGHASAAERCRGGALQVLHGGRRCPGGPRAPPGAGRPQPLRPGSRCSTGTCLSGSDTISLAVCGACSSPAHGRCLLPCRLAAATAMASRPPRRRCGCLVRVQAPVAQLVPGARVTAEHSSCLCLGVWLLQPQQPIACASRQQLRSGLAASYIQWCRILIGVMLQPLRPGSIS